MPIYDLRKLAWEALMKECDLQAKVAEELTVSILAGKLGLKGGDKMIAYQCECGAFADTMPDEETFLFRHSNGDHKLNVHVFFAGADPMKTDLCLKCKMKYLRLSLERLQKRRDKGEV